MKESNRQKKFGKLLQKELSEIFQREIVLESSPMLTVTVVRCSPDLRMARLFISVFPDDKAEAAIAEVQGKYREIRVLLTQRIKFTDQHRQRCAQFMTYFRQPATAAGVELLQLRCHMIDV